MGSKESLNYVVVIIPRIKYHLTSYWNQFRYFTDCIDLKLVIFFSFPYMIILSLLTKYNLFSFKLKSLWLWKGFFRSIVVFICPYNVHYHLPGANVSSSRSVLLDFSEITKYLPDSIGFEYDIRWDDNGNLSGFWNTSLHVQPKLYMYTNNINCKS